MTMQRTTQPTQPPPRRLTQKEWARHEPLIAFALKSGALRKNATDAVRRMAARIGVTVAQLEAQIMVLRYEDRNNGRRLGELTARHERDLQMSKEVDTKTKEYRSAIAALERAKTDVGAALEQKAALEEKVKTSHAVASIDITIKDASPEQVAKDAHEGLTVKLRLARLRLAVHEAEIRVDDRARELNAVLTPHEVETGVEAAIASNPASILETLRPLLAREAQLEADLSACRNRQMLELGKIHRAKHDHTALRASANLPAPPPLPMAKMPGGGPIPLNPANLVAALSDPNGMATIVPPKGVPGGELWPTMRIQRPQSKSEMKAPLLATLKREIRDVEAELGAHMRKRNENDDLAAEFRASEKEAAS